MNELGTSGCWQPGPINGYQTPGGRTHVARGVAPGSLIPSCSFFRPEGERRSVEHFILIKLNSMQAQKLQKLRWEVLAFVMLLLVGDVSQDGGHG
jgi:hypothetical protein